VAVEVAILLIIVYTPLGHMVFQTGPLPMWVYGPLIAGAIFLVLAEELRKLVAGRMRTGLSSGWRTTLFSSGQGRASV
jgi:sodium/potassium-transporting ATPase subunit alpha